jgi:hypothetical protein
VGTVSEKPTDLDAVQAADRLVQEDDRLVDRIGAGVDPGVDDELTRTLVRWRQQVRQEDTAAGAGELLEHVMRQWRRRARVRRVCRWLTFGRWPR